VQLKMQKALARPAEPGELALRGVARLAQRDGHQRLDAGRLAEVADRVRRRLGR